MDNKSFVLNEVGVLLGTTKGKINSMLFNVSYILDLGEIGNSEWITGFYFSYFITWKRETCKFVYNHTIMQQSHWVSLDYFYTHNSEMLSQSEIDSRELNICAPELNSIRSCKTRTNNKQHELI